MSVTGKMQAISSRGFRLQWVVTSSFDSDADLLTCEIVDGMGSVVAQESRPIRVRGAVITKESEVAQRDALISWAEDVTQYLIPPPHVAIPEPPETAEIPAAEENASHGEEISSPIPSFNDVEAQANDPV